jgi:trehalose 6-phosphate synthase/phosphatase
MGRLIIISNRLPFSIDKTGDQIRVRQSSGGLVSALKSHLDQDQSSDDSFDGQIWVGTLDADQDDWKKANELGLVSSEYGIEPIFPDKVVYEDFYNGFSNSTLWPLFHYFPSLVSYKKRTVRGLPKHESKLC